MSTTILTRADGEAMQLAARVAPALRYVDPTTGRPLADQRPIGAAMSEADYNRQQARHEEHRRDEERQQRERVQSSATLSAYHERERAELRAFCEAVAKHFRCPEMTSDQFEVKLKAPFQDLRRFAHHRRAEAERRAVDPSARKTA